MDKKAAILFVLYTHKWNSKERSLLKDAIIAKEAGFSVYILTNEDNFLSKIAKLNNLEVLPFKNSILNKFSDFHLLINVKKILREFKISIVHCYDFQFVVSLSIQMRNFKDLSLVITHDHNIDLPLKSFIYRPFFSRIESLIISNRIILSDALGNLGISAWKIKYLGMGIKPKFEDETPKLLKEEAYFKQFQNYFLAGTYVSPEISNLDEIAYLLYALKSINTKSPSGITSKLVLISEANFSEMKIFQSFKNLVEELALQEEVIFVTASEVELILDKLSLWISHSELEFIEDFTILALIHHLPILVPKNLATMELFREYQGIGESYSKQDARDLRVQWEKILMANSVYREKVRLYKFFIEREHAFEPYKSGLLEIYQKLLERRQRLVQKSQ